MLSFPKLYLKKIMFSVITVAPKTHQKARWHKFSKAETVI